MLEMRWSGRLLTLILLIFSFLLGNPGLLSAAKYSTPVKIHSAYGVFPQINDSGQMVWGGYSSGSYAVYFKNGSSTITLPGDRINGLTELKLNNKGQVAWLGYDGSDTEVFFYNGSTTKRLTDDALDANHLDLNEKGEVAWFIGSGGTYRPYLYSGGNTNPLAEAQSGYTGGMGLDLNDSSEVAWAFGGNVYLYSSTNIYPLNKKIAEGYNPALTNLGEVYYLYNRNIYRYSGAKSNVIVSSDIYSFDINDKMQIVYEKNTELYFYNGSTSIEISSNNFNKSQYYINNNGQVLWREGNYVSTIPDEDIFTFDSYTGFSLHLTPGNYQGGPCALNNKGEIVWSGNILDTSNTTGIYRTAPVNSSKYLTKYTFTYFYNNGSGDKYSGYFYGPDNYWVGSTKETTDENKVTGYYKITSATDASTAYSEWGKVYVTSYYDKETNKTYTPLNATQPMGSGLGSEVGYIQKTGSDLHKFGQGYYEADIPFDCYTFRYTYGNGDYYEGRVYANPGFNYYVGWKEIVKNETGKDGYYQILSQKYTGETDKYGKVYVDWYYDGNQSKQRLHPLNYTAPVGTSLLKSEQGYIKNANVEVYKFGRGYYEADLGDTYTYRYTYGNGDYYEGRVYRDPLSTVYYPTWKSVPKANETGAKGYYEILSVSHKGVASTLYGQVSVDRYFDGDYAKTVYQPVNNTSPLGTAYLGSELGYIKTAGVAAYKFGQGLYEADPFNWDTYTFKYLYGNGDYYEGKVYVNPANSPYHPGWKSAAIVNKTGKAGYYQITGQSTAGVSSSTYGQVFLTKYYDGDATIKTFIPLNSATPKGTNYLKSELGYIKNAGVSDYRFGMGLYEADAGDTYTFRYTYGNGDYYEGKVYRDPLNAFYYPGQKINVVNELKLPGYYQILGVRQSNAASSLYGKVYVTKYYDGDATKKPFTPLNSSTPIGTSYLRSELGYIKNAGVSDYRFGMGLYEADAGDTYTFRYTYGNGDYYEGKVYRDPLSAAYYPGYKINMINELKLTGYYQILVVGHSNVAASSYGQVFLTKYYDGDTTKKPFTPISSTTPKGTAYLKSELGYIKNDNVNVYKFGRGYEADAGDTYTFKYSYGNGDYYEGKVYRDPLSATYFPGYKKALTTKNETGFYGNYEITGVTHAGVSSSDFGQVFVSKYFDGDLTTLKLPVVNSGTPLGASFLGSEKGYIKTANVKEYYFSSYSEADAGDSYTFRYYYGNGDYYEGKVYRDPMSTIYYPGYKLVNKNELGKDGYYQVTGVSHGGVSSSSYGQVFLTQYYDGDTTKKIFTPVNSTTPKGTAYLKSELGYIKNDNVNVYTFGRGYYEADAGDTYTFKYFYGNGDYYEGKVYLDPLSWGYFPGYKKALTTRNETGFYGNYEITGVTYAGVSSSDYGKVFVSNYYDGDSTKIKLPIVDAASPPGTNLLGSEQGYVKTTAVADYFFSWYYEVDVGDTYLFKYSFGNGDYYTGKMYASPLGIYFPGWEKTLATKNEAGLYGVYKITKLAQSGVAASEYGKVYVESYYDGDQSKSNLSVVNNNVPRGTNFLGSEKGFIKKADVKEYAFSSFSEADAGDTYLFKYSYGNGDYYTGKVYAPIDYAYYPGWKYSSAVANETGKLGTYEIAAVSHTGIAVADYGKVYVSEYYDGDTSKAAIVPINSTTPAGSAYLGDEKGYLKKADEPYYLFSKYYEVDLGDTYTFRYNYNVSSLAEISNLYNDCEKPQINDDGWVVWEGYDGHDKEIYLYRGSGSPINVSNNDYDDYAPQINADGWVVWWGSDGHDYEIYLYKGSGAPINVSNNDHMFYDRDPQINANGWVVWQGYDGYDYEIYLYKGSGSPINVSNNDHSYDSTEYQINANGWVVWRGFDGHDYEIYLYKGSGSAINISTNGNDSLFNSYNDYNPQINANGWVVWRGFDGHDDEIYLYKGSGVPVNISNNDNSYGSYSDYDARINDAGWIVWQGFDGHDGEIYLYKGSGSPVNISNNDSYSPYTKDPFWSDHSPRINADGQVMWRGNDGSTYEVYLYQGSGTPIKISSSGSYSADTPQINAKGFVVWSQYVWKVLSGRYYHNYEIYLYRGSETVADYYSGKFYASPVAGFFIGWQAVRQSASGEKLGTYEVIGESYNGIANTEYGKVYVTNYYDEDASKKSFVPVNSGAPVGQHYLGDVKGYIKQSGVEANSFNPERDFDAGDTYTFKYTYGNGDYYTGKVYGSPEYSYYPGWKYSPVTANETGKTGTYEITKVSHTGVAASEYGKVYVTAYYDLDGPSPEAYGGTQLFTPNSAYTYFGAKYLGSEYGYFNSRTTTSSPNYFGGGYYEADEK